MSGFPDENELARLGVATIKLECTGCERRFRLKPVEGKPLPEQVECPRCGETIEVPREDSGWKKQQISRVFGRDEVEPERPEPGGHAPTPEKKSRVFRDVTQVNPSPMSQRSTGGTPEKTPETPIGAGADTSGEPEPDEDDAPSLGARLRELKNKRLEAPSLDDQSDATADTPASDEELDAEFDAIIDEAASVVDEASEVDEGPVEDPPGEDKSPAGPPPMPVVEEERENANEIANDNDTANQTDHATSPQSPVPSPREQSEPPSPGERSEPPYTVRVDDEVHRELGLDALAEIVRSGVWTEVVEVRNEAGEWVRLSSSNVMPRLRAHLADEAKSTLKLVATGEWEREEAEAEQPQVEQPDEPEEEAPREQPQGPKSQGAGTKILVAMVVVFGLAAAIGIYQWQNTQKNSSTESTPDANASGATAEPPAAVDESAESTTPVEAARAVVADAYNPTRTAEAMIEAGHYKAARHLAIDVWAADHDAAGLKATFNRAVKDDPALHPEVETLGEDIEIDRVFALGGGRSISFRLTNDGQSLYAFKPEQREWGRGWRAELAAYLFCEVVVCQFEVPKNQPVRISRETFEELYGLVETYRQTRYAERFEDLHWKEERGPDGQKREYLYGVLEAWVPGFVDWPVEYTSIWENWLDVRYHPGVLDEPLVEQLAPLQEKENSSAYSDILSERGGATTRDIARQLSSMLLFDFLTSNWDRFSDVEAYYGVNNQFADGRFV